jgi:hypothetical protein
MAEYGQSGQAKGGGSVDVEMTGNAAGADGPTAGTAVQAEGHGLMPRSELLPRLTTSGSAAPPAMADPAQPASPGQAGPGELLQFQLKQLIRGILAQQDLDPGIRLALLRHLSQNPGHPEQALLAHLRDVQDPEDLPPFKRRKPTMQSSGS